MKATNHQTKSTKTHCDLCAAAFPSKPDTGPSGYAVMPDGRQICYACADKHQREELKDRSRPFVAYLSGNTITTWTGGKLMDVTGSRPCRLTRQSFTHDKGSYRGSDGIAIKLRPVNG